MNLCNDEHEEVCYEGRKCPVCRLRSDLREDILAQQELIEELREQIEEAKVNWNE